MSALQAARHSILVIDDAPEIHKAIRLILRAGTKVSDSLDDLDAATLEDLEAAAFGEAPTAPGPRALDFEVDSAFQGGEGLERVRARRAEGRPYAMAFVDIRMPPGMDGVDTTAHLWEEDPDLQVVLCSAYSDYTWAQMVERLGISQRLLVLRKPFTAVEVRQLAHALVEKWRLLRRERSYREELEHRIEERTQDLKQKNEALARTLQELRTAQDRLIMQSGLATLGSLAAGIAHELRNPLNFVNNFASLTLEMARGLEEELRQLLGTIPTLAQDAIQDLSQNIQVNLTRVVEHGQRAARIIASLLEHAHTGPGEQSEFDLNTLVRECASLANHGMRARDSSFEVTVHLQLDASLRPMVAAQKEIGRVLLNLLDNACSATYSRLKATQGQSYTPEITIRSRDLGDRVELRVHDNGTGVPHAIRNRIFEPFFTTKPPGEGVGLGLSLSRELIEKGNGGTLHFESEEGQYSEFVITLHSRGWVA